MAKKLVIVESPAKAKTIGRFLGSDYTVEASYGHVRDLPDNRRGLPEDLRKKWWADYAVDVDNDFEPFYEVPASKKDQVTKLRAALSDASELILATDEDREGESISWHLLQVLKPKKSVPVRRIAFHELTKEAVLDALANPRPLNEKLVEAQEARRILDRLYGYTLSPVLWSKVAKDLSAGRVQSPAVKLIVEREKRRREFVSSVYWDLKAEMAAAGKTFPATLRTLDGTRLATGRDYDEITGRLKAKNVLELEEEEAGQLALAAREAKPWVIASVEKTPGTERPPAPFRTSTLQQEANRKLGFAAERTMRIAQDLYEGVDLGVGERVGLITYMRTDSLSLAEKALTEIRQTIEDRFGPEHVPTKPTRYQSKVANAQEAHEAIRPTDMARSPESIRRYLTNLSEGHFKLYDLIYRRALACQMKPAEIRRTTAEIEVEVEGRKLGFVATGKEITFPGFLLAYVEDSDDPEAEIEGKERILPPMEAGDTVELVRLEPDRHETRPPARYTDASLIDALEKLGIGRPSTYASILSVIEDRGYVRKRNRELVPTFLAFLAMDVLENFFQEFIDLKFTANMDASLDEIANGRTDSRAYLREFFLGGDSRIGLRDAVNERKPQIPFPNFLVGRDPESDQPIVVRYGKEGEPFLQWGEGESKKYANIPDDIAPADLTVAKALELLANKTKPAEIVGRDPNTGRNLILKFRQGYYLEVERTPEEIEAKVKPTWISLPPGANPRELSAEDLELLCRLPRQVGLHPESNEPVIFRLGKFGPYLQCGEEIRNVDDWRAGATMTLDEALEILKQPKTFRRAAVKAGPIAEFGELPGAQGPVKILNGRFGPYVTDGTTNATLPKDVDPAAVGAEQALEILLAKAAKGPSAPRGRARTKKAAVRPKAKAPAKTGTKGRSKRKSA
ncbi:MAG: type I DNA topoisomerase [Fimbriimonadaceae bacterium]